MDEAMKSNLMMNATSNLNESFAHQIEVLKSNLDNMFLVVNGILVFLMQPGFALLECGAVRSKNATNILFKNMLDACIAGVAYWLIGYAFAFGDGNPFIGYTYFAGYGMLPDKAAEWFFQYVFAATAATIVSGSLAERCDTTAYFVYSFVITGFIYPVITHWAWADGWLKDLGYKDFAGSGVVHLTGGTCALVGAVLLGPRIGRFDDNGKPNNIRGHSVPLCILGGMILMFGFLPFNGGSLGQISGEGDGATVAHAIFSTIISGSFGGLTVLIMVRAGIFGKPRVLSGLNALNGALTGMVSICAGCDVMASWGSAVTGMGGGLVFMGLHLLALRLRIDDPLDAIAVHLGGGLWGLIAAPLFRMEGKGGIILEGSHSSGLQLAHNLAGAAAIFAWSGTLSLIMFGFLKMIKRLRVDPTMELTGLDITKHNEPAYPADSWLEEQYKRISNSRRNTGADLPNLPPHMSFPKSIHTGRFLPQINVDKNKVFVEDITEPTSEPNGIHVISTTTNL